jgi:hypothetical protein
MYVILWEIRIFKTVAYLRHSKELGYLSWFTDYAKGRYNRRITVRLPAGV